MYIDPKTTDKISTILSYTRKKNDIHSSHTGLYFVQQNHNCIFFYNKSVSKAHFTGPHRLDLDILPPETIMGHACAVAELSCIKSTI